MTILEHVHERLSPSGTRVCRMVATPDFDASDMLCLRDFHVDLNAKLIASRQQVSTLTAALRRQIDEWYRRAGEYRREEQETWQEGAISPTPYRLQAEKYEKCADELAAALRAASEEDK